MAKKLLKRLGIGSGIVAGLLIIAVGVVYFRGQGRLSQIYVVPVDSLTLPTDAVSLERGRHLVGLLCSDCHGDDLAGTDFFNDPGLGTIHAKNLTSGQGGIGASYTDADFVRTLRHGVRPDGTSVFVMPSKDFHYLSDQDLGSIIAYLKALPPVNQEWGPKRFTLVGNVLLGVGAFDNFIMAEQIDHSAPRPTAPAIAVTKEYGEYLVRLGGCRQCHGAQLSGGKVDDPTSNLLGPNLTPGGELAAWSAADFITTIRTGVTPAQHTLNDMMPWKTYGKMSDDELQAVFLYLQALPKLATTIQ